MASDDTYDCPECWGTGSQLLPSGVWGDCDRCGGAGEILGPLTDEEMAKLIRNFQELRAMMTPRQRRLATSDDPEGEYP